MNLVHYGDTGLILLSLAICLLGAWAARASMGRFKMRDLNLASKVVLPLVEEERRPSPDTSFRRRPFAPKKRSKPLRVELQDYGKAAAQVKNYSSETLANVLSITAIVGDFAMIVFGFVEAVLLCQGNWIRSIIADAPMSSIAQNYKLILSGSIIVFWGLAGKGMYRTRNLLSPSKHWPKFIEPLFLCLVAFIIFDFAVKTNPQIPWFFFVCAMLSVFLNICIWHMLLSQVVRRTAVLNRLRRRLVVIGGGSQTMQIQKALETHSDLEFVGWVQAIRTNHVAALERFRLGPLHELPDILQKNGADVVVLTECESLQREGVLAVAKACENEHVQFKMVPHFFDIMISGLRPDRIGEIQLLGVDLLPLSGYRNCFLKRTTDIIGALVGLALAAPLILVFGAMVYLESPGPILFKQIRQGRNGKLFYILKIRSMHMNAEANGRPRWAQPNDARRLRIGAFIRKWNIDEVPQFWNVFTGEMSLVGPRPERPELIARFKSKFPHYQARHKCRPGMTGWAQVNGWRGDTDLEERIRHDIWYLENWNVWLDFQIMVQTFFRRKNAY